VSTILIGGASGFIGTRLTEALRADGHRVVRLARKSRARVAPEDVHWVPETGEIDQDALARARPNMVVNLAGEPIAQRWTSRTKDRIYTSRVRGTTALASAIAALDTPPSTFVSGSAIGYYGAHRGDEVLEENSASGSDYLAEVARDWERSTQPAADAGIRVVTLRTGIVLGRDGGALARLLLPFRLGVGGRIGTGRQWMSWISREDCVRAIRYALDTATLRDGTNVVAPNPVRNMEFAKTLARVLRRPAFIPTPAIGLELIFGSMARNTILADQRVVPQKLAGAGFEFRHPRLEDALRFELRR
jgi:uncharacterized protein (TIGR01777 family)